MARNILFLIHGIGRHADDWATQKDGPITALEEAAQRYAFFKGKKLGDFIEFVPIRYDDLFDRILDGWANLSDSVLKNAGPVSEACIAETLDAVKKAGDDKNQFIRIGGDVLLYRGFKLFSQRVKLRVLSKMAETIAARATGSSGTPVRFSIAAHSMGTAVAHDALHHLGTEDWLAKDYRYEFEDDKKEADKEAASLKKSLSKKNPFSPEVFRFDCLFMLSNTSCLLHTTPGTPYTTIVKPGTAGHRDSYVQTYFNIDHQFDPVSKMCRFVMPDNWKMHGGGIDISDLNHFHDPNIHGFRHYLTHPKVHLQMFRSLINSYEPTQADLDILDDFPRWGGTFSSPSDQLREKLRVLVESAKVKNTLRQFIEIYQELTGRTII